MIRKQVTARYQLLPTWYTLFAEWSLAGLPVIRPTWYHNMDDARAFKHHNDEFLVGDSILVRAANKPGMSKADVYFPKGGEWFDFWDEKAKPVAGGQVLSVNIADDHIPA